MKSSRSKSTEVLPVPRPKSPLVSAARKTVKVRKSPRTSPRHPPCVLVIEDHPLMRLALGTTIRRVSPQASIVEVDRLAELRRQYIDGVSPDLICVDLRLPDAAGMTALREVRKLFPEVPVIVFSASSAADVADIALELGANAYLEKTASSAVLQEELLNYLEPDTGLTSELMKLSRRQKQLLTLMNSGMSNRFMGEELGISEHTVKVHLWRLYKQMNVSSRAQATHLARSIGVVV
jgi:DNA-binding NarL/FixJ family response regulator